MWGMAKKTINDCFKIVDIFTKDLPVRAIYAPVIMHTIGPLRRTITEQRQDMVRGTCPAVFLDCHCIRIFAVSTFPFTLKNCS